MPNPESPSDHRRRRVADNEVREFWTESFGQLYETRAVVMAKVRSERDLVDNGIRALVGALGYSGAARFLRHFSKGNGDYLQIQSKLFKGIASGTDIQKGRRALFQQAE